MATSSNQASVELLASLAEAARIRNSEAQPRDFWPAFLETLARMAAASAGYIVLREGDDGPWKRIAAWRASGPARKGAGAFAEGVDPLAEQVAGEGSAIAAMGDHASGRPAHAVGVRLETGGDHHCAALLLLGTVTEAEAAEVLTRLVLMADSPRVYQLQRELLRARQDVGHFASVLEVLGTMQKERRFLAAALAFVNELAARLPCDRISLGWMERGQYIRLRAISHTERFDRKMEAVRQVEYAMEEAADQDDEVVVPPPPDSPLIVRDHRTYQKENGLACLGSVPVRARDEVVGVITCEREAPPFSETDTRLLRIACDLAASRLDDLKQRDRWFGARWASTCRGWMAKLVGVEHTWIKLLALGLAIGFGVLLFGRMDYRVEASFIVQTEDAATVPAPFEGYLAEVHVEPGDRVEPGQAVASLDTRELLLEEASALADRQRYLREAEKARASGALADMRIADALADQANARLRLIRHRLAQAEVRSPLAGVVVEGDLRERIGSPVQRGDALFRIAHPDRLYVEMKVSEADIHAVIAPAKAVIAFSSQPRLKFPAEVVRVDPVARPDEGSNVFTVRGELEGEPQPWWRPGMSGVAKIHAGRRNILWVFTHKTVDFLRMKLWM